ncbi:hypothetical protein [Planococcus soli]|uniref:hypothetical protein n=1 Tax=Planococcus soli TaxID=2666072 RepID=UPI00115E318E|nr:hypothetical protein [Planococcus soli]
MPFFDYANKLADSANKLGYSANKTCIPQTTRAYPQIKIEIDDLSLIKTHKFATFNKKIPGAQLGSWDFIG